MKQRRSIMQLAGYTVQSAWIDEVCPSDAKASEALMAANAAKDFYECVTCDCMIVFPGKGAGHHTEFGIALALGKTLVVVGEKNNIFHYMDGVLHFYDLDDLMEALANDDAAFDLP
jgi:hypothetical protein